MRLPSICRFAIVAALSCNAHGVAQSSELPFVLVIADALESDLRSRAVISALEESLAAAGLIDGETVELEFFHNWDLGAVERRLDAQAQDELAVIVTQSAEATAAAMAFTNSVPIVVGANVDLLESGFVASLANPGGNVTGLSTQTEELWEKRVSFLDQIVPDLETIAVFGADQTPEEQNRLLRASRVVGRMGLDVSIFGISDSGDLWPTIKAIAAEGTDGVLILDDAMMVGRQRNVVAWHAQGEKLPTVASDRAYAEDGALLSYGANVTAQQARVANYVKRILEGADPATLPIEQPTELELVINKATADYLGLSVPLAFLLRADEVIE